MTPKPSLSAIKRVFFSPISEQKLDEMRDRHHREILRIDLFNIR